jgi:hypothetical protein
MAQRAQKYFHSLSQEIRNGIEERLGSSTVTALLNIPARWILERRNNRLFLQ